MKTLIVEHCPTERALLEEQFYLLEHEVTACATAKIALEYCQKTLYPLIVMDLELPDMNGVEFCRQLRGLPQGENNMILVITGHDKLKGLQAAIEAGADDYLTRPIDINLLKVRLTIIEQQLHCLAEHRQAEEALRISQTFAKNIIESSLDMIIAVDTERRIIEFNRAAQKTFGYRLEEVLGKHVDMLYADKTESNTVPRTMIEHGRYVQEIYNKRKNGEIFPCLLSASILRDAQGNQVGFMGISRDITERKRAEEALKKAHAELEQQNVELARASKLKDEFLSVMSHELRSPLTVVLSQSELLQEGLYGRLNKKQLEAVESIGKSGHRLLALINDILDFSKISQGEFKLKRAPVSVEAICQTCLQATSDQAQEKHLKISSMVDRSVTIIQADEVRLKQVLLKLLGNAVKFTNEGGEIGLEIHGDTEQHMVHIVVWDTGIGIAEEDKKHLFQPFVQLNRGLTREYIGTGLGLSMVCHIVNMHGGSISVESEIGKGSRFTVSLPW